MPSGTFQSVSTGRTHTCAIRTDGVLACWGRNDFGQSQPLQIGDAPPAATTGAPYSHQFANHSSGRRGPEFFVSAGRSPTG